MYSFTSIDLEFRRYRNLIPDLKCGCGCDIPIDADMFYICGARRYEKMWYLQEGGVEVKKMAPYIPQEVWRKNRKLDKESWRDRFSARVCGGCMELLLKFCRQRGLGSLALPQIKYERTYRGHVPPFTWRWYSSLLSYDCRSCGARIEPGDDYVRIGIYQNCYCKQCMPKIKILIGGESSF